jgi:flagellar motor switch/type III secretory pathway protein FliN
MSELSPTIVDVVLAACTAGASEAAGSLGRSLDGAFTLGTPEAAEYNAAAPPAGFDGPGLLVVLTFGNAGLAIALPESSGLLPAWYAAPDATGESKLSTLAQELSMLLVPETLMADKFEARRVASLAAALASGGAAADAALVSLPAASGAKSGSLSVVWPLATPAAALAAASAAAADEPSMSPSANAGPASDAAPGAAKVRSLSQLPHYSRSLLKIRIPVQVQLASKKETVAEVVEIVPGAIIKFDKGCDELLHMFVGGQPIAEGEAVKIGDKFGFRVTGMVLPREHFVPARRPRAG